jgi:hypothetical protein
MRLFTQELWGDGGVGGEEFQHRPFAETCAQVVISGILVFITVFTKSRIDILLRATVILPTFLIFIEIGTEVCFFFHEWEYSFELGNT